VQGSGKGRRPSEVTCESRSGVVLLMKCQRAGKSPDSACDANRNLHVPGGKGTGPQESVLFGSYSSLVSRFHRMLVNHASCDQEHTDDHHAEVDGHAPATTATKRDTHRGNTQPIRLGLSQNGYGLTLVFLTHGFWAGRKSPILGGMGGPGGPKNHSKGGGPKPYKIIDTGGASCLVPMYLQSEKQY
jgi:hypothetical protein